LSRRQAYRYLELARAGAPAPAAAENSVTITLKMPESLAHALRAHATERSVTTSEVVRQAVAAFLAAKRRHG
jgi:predicted GNAT superfamily acetyltransferase